MNGSTNVLAIAGDISLFGLRAVTDAFRRRFEAAQIRRQSAELMEYSRNSASHAASARTASCLPTSSTTFSTWFMITSFPYFGESIPLIFSIA
jgi:hypothetical protein